MRKTIATLALLLAGATVWAEEIRLDFNDAVTPGGNWNVAAAPGDSPLSGLIDYTTGNATSIDVSWTGLDSTYDDLGNWTGGTKDWMNDAAGDDGFYTSDNASVTFSGLSAGPYKVEVFMGYISSLETLYRINEVGATGTHNDPATPFTGNWNWQTHGTDASNWMIWDSVTPTANKIKIDMIGTYSGVSAVRIQSIPEPATLAFISIFGIGLITVRRIFMI